MLAKLMCYGCASVLTVTFLFLTGCGGGSSTTTATSTVTSLKGVAAKGAPLANATITLTDSTGKIISATTKADGSFSFDVTGLTAPFVLKAISGTIKLFSVQDTAPASGQTITVNITPITSAIAGVLSTTGKPADLSPVTNKTVIITKLTSVKTFIQKSLQPSLTVANVPTTFDPINDSFDADGTGFDSVLDNVQVAQSSTNDIFLVDKNMIKTCPTSPFNPGCYSVSDPGNTTSTNANICGSDIATGAPIPCDPKKPMNESAYNPIALAPGATTLGCTGCVSMSNDDNFTARTSTATTLTVTGVTPDSATSTTTTPTTSTPTTTTPTTTTPPSTGSGSISVGAANGYTCASAQSAFGNCSYINSCASNSGDGSGYYQTNLGTYRFSSSSGISAAASAAVNACVPR
jgi:hypothetical protein